ncbi:hypothetical protein [uncultured Psychroserpens sp.]|uniref:hypothetical protein n=1 Tax=uncultured Psychroserpens sp. TaxID=255436 RepID=UPI00261C646F|nr:hypothetical protein [uncultured Psychroserpens sp.]
MKTTRNLLLFIGSAGLSAAFFGIVNGDAITDHLMTIVCGSSLIYGYFQLKKASTSCKL